MIFDASSIYILLKKGKPEILRDTMTLDFAFYEIGNALVKELRRKLISEESFTTMVEVLAALNELMTVVKFERLEPNSVAKASKVSGLTFYDASYLALAVMSKDSITTDDGKLCEEALKMKLRVFKASS